MPDRVAIIDADLIGRKRHRFPNLALMKWSAYEKANGSVVTRFRVIKTYQEDVPGKSYEKVMRAAS